MGYFKYKMIRRDGHILHGVIELPFNAEAAAGEHFEKRGLTVITIQRISEVAGWLYELINTRLRRKVKREDLIEFLRNMGVMLRSGVPILTALEDVTGHSENQDLARIAEDVRMSIEAGTGLADAIDRHPTVFPDAVRQVIRIGEETGSLDRTLMDAAAHLERMQKINTDTKKSLIYPLFVVAALLGATGFWVYYVIPSVADLFRNLNVELPRVTVLVMTSVEFLVRNFRLMLMIAVLIVAAIFLSFRLIPWLPKQFHRLLMVLPITGKIVRASNLAFIAEYFSLFISSGVNILRSLEILRDSVHNEVYKEKLRVVREGLMRGNTLSRELGRAQVFPSFVVRMIHVGELSGNLAEQLQYVAADYRRRLNIIVDNLSEIMKPVVILIVGALFVFIVIALFLPIYYLVGEISGGSTY